MKTALAFAAALALCGSAFATTAHGVVSTVKKDAHQIGSSFMHDAKRIAHGDTYRQSQGHAASASHTSAMGAGPADSSMSSARQRRMDDAYARWERTRR